MADDATIAQLAKTLAGQEERYPHGKPRFPTVNPFAYFHEPSQKNLAKEPWHEGLPAYAAAALAAMRPSAHTTSMQAFNPKAPAQPLPMRPTIDGEAIAQAGWEAALGRPPGGAPGSGHWNANGRFPIPKSPLAWLMMGGAGYGTYSAMGGPEAWDKLRERPWNTHTSVCCFLHWQFLLVHLIFMVWYASCRHFGV